MKRKVVEMQKFRCVALALSVTVLFLMSNITSAVEYQGDGTYNLKVGDSVRTTNGYRVKLVVAWGEMGTRSDWRTDFVIYDLDGKVVGYEITFENSNVKTDTLHITVKRYVENEALVMVTSLWPHENDEDAYRVFIIATSLIIALGVLLVTFKRYKQR